MLAAWSWENTQEKLCSDTKPHFPRLVLIWASQSNFPDFSSPRTNQEAVYAVCPALCLPGKHKPWEWGWACWAAESRGDTASSSSGDRPPAYSQAPPRAIWSQPDTGHESSPCKITAFIKIANTCLEQLLNVTQHQRAAGETTEIPAPSPESRGQRGRFLQHRAHLQAVIPAEVQQLGAHSRKNSRAVTFTTHTGLTTL